MRNVLIADDHDVTRRGVREILRDAFEGLSVTEARAGGEVLAELERSSFDLILLDVLMPGPGILPLLAAVRAKDAKVPVLVLTAAKEIEYVVQCLRAGANGLIHKDRATDELLEAIKKVGSGSHYLHPDTAAKLAAVMGQDKDGLPHDKLSRRELEIFRLIALGRAVKEIAGELALSDKTVATYLNRIREKTGLGSHVEIARYALQHHLVS